MSLNLSVKFLFGVTLLFCAPILFTNGMVGNFGDIYQYAAPFRHFSAETLQTGQIPLWNPYIFGGAPFLASPQSAIFYPLTLLFYFLPLNIAFNIFTFFHLFLNALGFYLLLKSLKFSNSGSLWGSLVWGFSSFFLSKVSAGHVIHLSSYSWFGFVLLFAVVSWRSTNLSLSLFCFILAYALQFFSGHLQVSFHTTLLIAILFLSAVIPAEAGIQKLKSFFRWGLFSIGIFIVLVSIQLLPSLTFLTQSMRIGTSSLFDPQSAYNFATSYSMQWKDLICLVYQNFFGNPLSKNYVDPPHPSLFFETQAIYFGLIPILMAIAGNFFLLKKKRLYLPILSVFFLVLAMGKNGAIYNLLWNLLSFLRVPARFFFLFLATSVLIAAIYWEENVIPRGRKIIGILFLLTFFDLFLAGRTWFWAEDPARKLGRSPAMEWLQTLLRERPSNGKMNRIFTTAEISNPNKAIFFHLENLNGYEAILQRSFLRYFSASQGPQNVSSTGATDAPNPNEPFFSQSGVRYLVTLGSMNYPWPLKYNDGQVKIYENPNLTDLSKKEKFQYSLPRPNPNKMILKPKENRMQNGAIKILEASYPGWKAWEEQEKESTLLGKEGYFQIVKNSSSSSYSRIYLLFHPLDFIAGAILSMIAIIILFFVGIRTLAYRELPSIQPQPSRLAPRLVPGTEGDWRQTNTP